MSVNGKNHYSVLIIDDEVGYRDLLKMYLENDKEVEYCFFDADDEKSAFKVLEKNEIDCVICDYKLGPNDGFKIVDRIRKEDKYINIPIIMMTGFSHEDLIKKAFKNGCDEYYNKNNADLTGFSSILRATVENKRRKLEIEKQKLAFKDLFNALSDAVFIHNLKGEFIEVNDEACRRLGYSREEFKKMTPMDIDSGKYASMVESRIKTLLKEKKLKFESEHVTKDNKVIPVQISSKVIKFMGEDAIISIARDFKDIKNYQMELIESERKYRRLVEELHEGLWQVDEDGTTFYVNNSMANMLGYDQNEMIGKSIFEFVGEDWKEVTIKYINSKKRRKEAHEFRFVKKDGTHLWVLMSTRPLRDKEGSYIGAMAVISDITELKGMRDESDMMKETAIKTSRLAELGLIAAGISHELKNPLAVIQSNVDLIDMEIDNEDVKENIETIHASIKKMVIYIDRFKEYAKPSNVVISEANVHLIIDTAFSLFGKQLANHQIKVEKNYSKYDPMILCDASKLEQVFINLIINSRHALEGMENKEIKVATKLKAGKVIIEFTDTGCGIPDEIIEDIFKPFLTTKDEGEGTGLGLSIIRNVIEEHKGEIIIKKTKVGEGTTFQITLPQHTIV